MSALCAINIPEVLSREAARAVLLAAQGIETQFRVPATKAGVLEAIRTIGQLQIDTIHVVARSPYFVLWTRLGSYDPAWIDELVAEGALYETWSHAACFLPVEMFPYTRSRIQSLESWRPRYYEFIAEHRQEADRLLALIRTNGPVRSADFENEPGARGGWWEWKHEKQLLESLFTEGSLMVARREKFQRVYDLRERVMPGWDDLRTPAYAETVRAYVLQTVKSLGVATAAWIPDYYRLRVDEVRPALAELVATGELLVTEIAGIKGVAYVHPVNSELAVAAADGRLTSVRTTLLSPFDPVVWHRRRGEELFDFSYLIECYTPAEKRRYGYFSLPILHRGALVGRLDAKAHRKEQLFEVRQLHLETGFLPSEEFAASLAEALLECAAWHSTPTVIVRKSSPRSFAGLLRGHIKARKSAILT